MAANGGYVNTDNLPILSGYQEKIEELRKQLAFPNKPTAIEQPKSSLDELAAAYVDSVFDNTQDDSAWNTAAPVVEERSQSESTNAEKESDERTSSIIPIAGGLYYNTETGEYIDNYNYEGNAATGQSGNSGNTGQTTAPGGMTYTPGVEGGDIIY